MVTVQNGSRRCEASRDVGMLSFHISKLLDASKQILELAFFAIHWFVNCNFGYFVAGMTNLKTQTVHASCCPPFIIHDPLSSISMTWVHL